MLRMTLRSLLVFGALFAAFLNVTVTERPAQAFFQPTEPPADGSMPECLGLAGEALPIDNARVIELKRTTRNQYKDRGFVQGTVTQLFKRKGDHSHFEIRIGTGAKDVIEIVFNRDFGNPIVEAGDHVIACGDYITSYAKSGGYDASPSDALIHWVHENDRGGPHPDGFVIVNRAELHGYGQRARPVRVGQ